MTIRLGSYSIPTAYNIYVIIYMHTNIYIYNYIYICIYSIYIYIHYTSCKFWDIPLSWYSTRWVDCAVGMFFPSTSHDIDSGFCGRSLGYSLPDVRHQGVYRTHADGMGIACIALATNHIPRPVMLLKCTESVLILLYCRFLSLFRSN